MPILKTRIIRPKELSEILGVSRTTLWRMQNRGNLPNCIRISAGAVGWIESDIENWLKAKKAGKSSF